MYEVERRCMQEGHRRVAGTDEAGRGPLAGPVVAAAVVLDPENPIGRLADSKVLRAVIREELYEEIVEKALGTSIVFIDAGVIDTINIYRAAQKAMTDAVLSLPFMPDKVLSDAMPLPLKDIPFEAIVSGDRLSASIAAASILAKVARDRHMDRLARRYPAYGFETHKGYPTKAHLRALEEHGPCAVHRRSFKPVKERLAKQQHLSLEVDIWKSD